MFLDHGPVQFCEGGFGVRIVLVEEALLEEDVTGRPTRISSGDGAPADIGLSLGRRNPDGLIRARARS